MKTLQEIKNTYAIEQCYEDWESFLNYYGGRHPEWFDQHWTEICIRAQKLALKKASQNANTMQVPDPDFGGYGECRTFTEINKQSITNPENLIR